MSRKNENVVAPPQKQKEWRIDRIINDDRLQMLNLVKKMQKFRTENFSGNKATNHSENININNKSAQVFSNKPPTRKKTVTKKPVSQKYKK
jgi:hypothetical protein